MEDAESNGGQTGGRAGDGEKGQQSSGAAGETLNSLKSQFTQTCDYLTKAINDEPVKAVLITAAVSSLVTALVVSALRNDDRYF